MKAVQQRAVVRVDLQGAQHAHGTFPHNGIADELLFKAGRVVDMPLQIEIQHNAAALFHNDAVALVLQPVLPQLFVFAGKIFQPFTLVNAHDAGKEYPVGPLDGQNADGNRVIRAVPPETAEVFATGLAVSGFPRAVMKAVEALPVAGVDHAVADGALEFFQRSFRGQGQKFVARTADGLIPSALHVQFVNFVRSVLEGEGVNFRDADLLALFSAFGDVGNDVVGQVLAPVAQEVEAGFYPQDFAGRPAHAVFAGQNILAAPAGRAELRQPQIFPQHGFVFGQNRMEQRAAQHLLIEACRGKSGADRMRAVADVVLPAVEINAQNDAEGVLEEQMAFEGPFRPVQHKFPPVAALALHPVHGFVGGMKEQIVGGPLGGESHADAEGQAAVRVFPAERVAHAPRHAVRHGLGFPFGGNVLQKGDELVAAGAGQEIPAAKLFFKYFREADQRGVAFQVAVPVVDAFEIIQVEEQQGRGVPALVDVKIGLDVLPGVVVIVQAGERVLAGALHQFVVAEFPVGDVQKNADVNPFTVLVRGQATFFQSPDQIAVGFSDPVFLLVIVALRVRAGRRDAPAVIGVDDAGQLAAAGLFKLLAGVAEQGEQAVADIGQRSSGLGRGR